MNLAQTRLYTNFSKFLLFGTALMYLGIAKGQTPKSEKVHVHLPKSLLITEEVIPMEISVMNGEEFSRSAFVYVEILNRSGESMSGHIFPLQNGQSMAHLEAPSSIPSDNYLLSVYTRLGAQTKDINAFYLQPITIINPQIAPITIKKEIPDGLWEKTKNNKALSITEPRKNGKPQDTLDLKVTGLPPNGEYTVSIAPSNPFLSWKEIVPKGNHQPTANVYDNALAEYHGHIIKGSVLREEQDTTSTYFLSSHGKQYRLYSSRPNKNGDLYFDLDVTQDYSYFILQKEGGKPTDAELLPPFIGGCFPEYLDLPPLLVDKDFRDELDHWALSASVSKVFYHGDTLPSPQWATSFLYDSHYLLDDYTRFEDLATTLKEYVPGVIVRNQNGKTYFKLQNNPGEGTFDDPPLFLVDGMPVFDSHKLGKFDPRNFREMFILNREFYLGESQFDGLVYFESFENDFGGYSLPENALYIEYPRIQPPLDWHYNVPKQAREDSRFPDNRNVLLWEQSNADEEGNAKIQFHPTNYRGTFEISISYLDHKGNIQTAQKLIQIDPSGKLRAENTVEHKLE